MVWNLEDNSDTYKERKVYSYVFKQSKNPEFAKNIERFLNLYEYLTCPIEKNQHLFY